MWNYWMRKAGKYLASKMCCPGACKPLALPLVFEHVTQQLLHWSVPYGLSEEEELDALSCDEPQGWEQEEQFPKPEWEKGCCQASLRARQWGRGVERGAQG